MRLKRKDGQCCNCKSVSALDSCECNQCGGDVHLPFEVPNMLGWETHAGAPTRLDGVTPINVRIQCRKRGGIATMIGFGEFGAPSARPRKYRRKDSSGDATSQPYTGYCSTPHGDPITCTYNYTCQYDWLTTSLSSSGNIVCTGLPGPVSPNCNFVLAQQCGLNVTQTQTHAEWVPTNACCDDVGGNTIQTPSASRTMDLSDEETEVDAIDRLLANTPWAPISWSFVVDVETPGQCLRAVCCQAHYFDRGAGFSFGYQQAQWRAAPTGQGIEAGCYAIRVPYLRRPAGSGGAWSQVGFDEVLVQVGEDGTAEMYNLD
jgi:hypothetical protein